jgi:hypothetical protein
MTWFNREVVKVLRGRRTFDKEGILIGDGSYLFVPDNPKYENSVRMLFDEHNHPVSKEGFKKKTDEQKARCRWRRCYKMVTLLHTNRKLEFFLFLAVTVVPGKANECPVLYRQVKQLVDGVGKGVMKRLVVDRGFLDGKEISACKRDYGIDVLIPVRRNMDIYEDARALFGQTEVDWALYEEPRAEPQKRLRPRPKAVLEREKKRQQTLKEKEQPPAPKLPEEQLVRTEVAAIGEFRSWSSCTVPLSVVATRDHYADGHDETWFLLDTKQELRDPRQSRRDYALRTSIEERYRHLKCFCDLTHFTSRAYSLVVNQVVFMLLRQSK